MEVKKKTGHFAGLARPACRIKMILEISRVGRVGSGQKVFYSKPQRSGRVGSGRVGSGKEVLEISRIGPRRVEPDKVGYGWVGSGLVWRLSNLAGRVGSGRVGSGQKVLESSGELGRVESGQEAFMSHGSGPVTLTNSDPRKDIRHVKSAEIKVGCTLSCSMRHES